MASCSLSLRPFLITVCVVFCAFLAAENRVVVASSGVKEVEQCLAQIEPCICDPECVLSDQDVAQVNAALVQLENSTRTVAEPAFAGYQGPTCEPIGLKLQMLLFQNVEEQYKIRAKIVEMHANSTAANPCARSAVTAFIVAPDGGVQMLAAVVSRNAHISGAELVQQCEAESAKYGKDQLAQLLLDFIAQVNAKCV